MSRNLFARLLLVPKSRDIDMQNVLSYCLGVYPLSLASVNGSLLKTAKSKLADILESASGNPHVDKTDIPNDNALVVDAMAVVQCLKGNWKTFGDFADSSFRIPHEISSGLSCKKTRFCCRSLSCSEYQEH